MCTTTTHYATHISTECSRGGSAQCDGICDLHGVECTCSCHEAFDLPQTIPGVLAWHDERNDVVARFEDRNTPALIEKVTAERNRLQMQHADLWNGVRGAQFRTMASTDGHGYVYVVFS